jgi:hypothetical protein
MSDLTPRSSRSEMWAEIERLRERIADAETSLAIWDASKSSEYWFRHPEPLHVQQQGGAND